MTIICYPYVSDYQLIASLDIFTTLVNAQIFWIIENPDLIKNFLNRV